MAGLLVYEDFKRSSLPRIKVKPAPKLQEAAEPAVAANLTSTHAVALNGEKYGSAGKQALEVKRHNEMN